MTASTPTLLIGIAVLAVGTYSLRLAGPLLAARWASFQWATSPRFTQLVRIGPVVILAALAAITTAYEGSEWAGPSRLLGVTVGGLLAWRRQPFVVVVLAAAATAAAGRLAGLR